MPDLDDVADDLYGAPPADFIARRDDAARAARAAGDRETARRIAALRKPTVSAWLVNLLFRDDDTLADQLVGLGDQLREAERGLDGPELRALSKARRELVRGLVARARTLARAQGHKTSESVAQEVDATLTAALADPSVADEVTSGRLTGPREFAGFGSTAARPELHVVGGTARRTTSSRADAPTREAAGADTEDDAPDGAPDDGPRPTKSAEDRRAAEEAKARAEEERRERERRARLRKEREEELAAAEERWRTARETARQAAADHDAADDAHREAAAAVRELESKLKAAQRDLTAAERALETTEAKERKAREAVEAATEEIREAEARLDEV